MTMHYLLTIALLLDAACIVVGMRLGKNMQPMILIYWFLLTIRYSIEVWR